MNPPEKQEIIRNPDGTFPPGVSGNPGGRPKGKSLKTFAREYLESLDDEGKKAYMEKLPAELVWRMAEGNPSNENKHELTPETIKAINYIIPHGTDTPAHV